MDSFYILFFFLPFLSNHFTKYSKMKCILRKIILESKLHFVNKIFQLPIQLAKKKNDDFMLFLEMNLFWIKILAFRVCRVLFVRYTLTHTYECIWMNIFCLTSRLNFKCHAELCGNYSFAWIMRQFSHLIWCIVNNKKFQNNKKINQFVWNFWVFAWIQSKIVIKNKMINKWWLINENITHINVICLWAISVRVWEKNSTSFKKYQLKVIDVIHTIVGKLFSDFFFSLISVEL